MDSLTNSIFQNKITVTYIPKACDFEAAAQSLTKQLYYNLIPIVIIFDGDGFSCMGDHTGFPLLSYFQTFIIFS